MPGLAPWRTLGHVKIEQRHQDATIEPGFVWVFQYVHWDEASQSQKTSKRFATLDVIRCGLGEPIHSSAKKVRLADLIDGAFVE